MKKMKIYFFYAFLLGVLGVNTVGAQNSLVAISPSVKYDNAVKGAEKYLLPSSENPLDAIVKKLEAKSFNELHIYALAEADNIVFHGLSLCASNLEENKAELSKFKAFQVRIVFHSKVLGKTEEGKKFLNQLSEQMGNVVVVE